MPAKQSRQQFPGWNCRYPTVSSPPDQPNSPPMAVSCLLTPLLISKERQMPTRLWVFTWKNVLALRVVQQPTTNQFCFHPGGECHPVFAGLQFFGHIGLLAHNFLSGKLFFNLKEGDIVRVIMAMAMCMNMRLKELNLTRL